MKWNPEDEIEFIVRKLNHELTTAEERQFQCWLAEDQAHRSLFQEIESISLRSKEAKIVFEPDIELALQKVKSRRARMERLRHRIWQYAALILVALGLGIYGTYRFADRYPSDSRHYAADGYFSAVPDFENGQGQRQHRCFPPRCSGRNQSRIESRTDRCDQRRLGS